eukprot:2086490-Amphidinium_carterae.1
MVDPFLVMLMDASMSSRSPRREPGGGVPSSKSFESGCLWKVCLAKVSIELSCTHEGSNRCPLSSAPKRISCACSLRYLGVRTFVTCRLSLSLVEA